MALSDNLRELLNLSHAIAWEGADAASKNADEPGLISGLLDNTVQIGLELELKALYAGIANVQIDSIFTHKTPTVEPIGQSAVEIGDLLLIRQHFSTTGGKPQGKALLLQAKKNAAPNSGTFASGKPTIQFELYRDWPSFKGATRLNPFPDPASLQPWDFKLTDPNGRFGEYLAVFNEKAHSFTAPTALGAETPAFAASLYPPTPGPKTTWSNGALALPPSVQPIPVDCHKDFAETLAEMFVGGAGEPFVPGLISGSDHWSIFINTMLLEATMSDYTYVSRRTNVNNDTPRGATICAFMATQPFIKLAVMREMQWYSGQPDDYGLPDFEMEPHFFHASRKSQFVSDLYHISEEFRHEIRRMPEGPSSARRKDRGDEPPSPPDSPIPRRDGNHVPILSIATSGPGPAWEETPHRKG